MFLKNYRLYDLSHDLIAGIGLFLVTIPLAVGYAQVAGLPPAYGLFGSIAPVIVFGLLSGSREMVLGIDAAPAALLGEFLTLAGIHAGSAEATSAVPVVTLLAAGWLFLFGCLHAERILRYVSMSVMAGFLSGLFTNVMLMRLPTLFGGEAGWGNVRETIPHLLHEAGARFNLPSFLTGAVTIVALLLLRRYFPRFPKMLAVLACGILMGRFLPMKEWGIAMLDILPGDIRRFSLPDFAAIEDCLGNAVLVSFFIAFTIFIESLNMLQEEDMEHAPDPKTNANREVFVYACANAAAAFSGCCAVNGSVYRTKYTTILGGRTQMVSLIGAALTAVGLLFGTGFIDYIPLPVLTAVLLVALGRSTEFRRMPALYRGDKKEFVMFWLVVGSVLLLGAELGFFVGVILSFVSVIIHAAGPVRSFVGYNEAVDRFLPLDRVSGTRPIQKVVIYQFRGNLFFANIGLLEDDLEKAVREKPDTRVLILDARAVGEIDYAAAGRLLRFYGQMRRRGIHFYITQHSASLNDRLRALGAGKLLEESAVRPRIQDVLAQENLRKPYPLEAGQEAENGEMDASEGKMKLIAEYEWAYGRDANRKMREHAVAAARKIIEEKDVDIANLARSERRVFGRLFSILDEEEFLDLLEMEMADLAASKELTDGEFDELNRVIVQYHAELDERLRREDEELYQQILEARQRRRNEFEARHPAVRRLLRRQREELRRIHEEFANRAEAPHGPSAGERTKKD